MSVRAAQHSNYKLHLLRLIKIFKVAVLVSIFDQLSARIDFAFDSFQGNWHDIVI